MSFPKELTALPQWICWRLEPDPKGGKPRKVPYDPKTGRKGSSTNPQAWGTIAQAEAARAILRQMPTEEASPRIPGNASGKIPKVRPGKVRP